jgi:hypothetical protein
MLAIIKYIQHYITIVANIPSSNIQLIKVHIHNSQVYYGMELIFTENLLFHNPTLINSNQKRQKRCLI